MIRIGNQVISGPQKPNLEPEPQKSQNQRQSRFGGNSSGGGKRGRSVSVLKVKDPKIELDLLASLLDDVENAEKQIQEQIENDEEQDFECQIKASKHEFRDITKSLMMSIISDEEYNGTVALKLIEVLLKKNGKPIITSNTICL